MRPHQRVVRCLQSRLGEGADWLMSDAADQRVVLEVGGTDEGRIEALLSVKMGKLEGRCSHGTPRLLPAWYASLTLEPCCRATMNRDELNHRVTNAIVCAEGLPAGSREAWEAFHEVSSLEESIATITPPDDLEGEIARLGAVTAALSAGEPLRALQLAERFLAESLAPEIAGKLRQLVTEADAELARVVTDEPTVKLVKFSLRAA